MDGSVYGSGAGGGPTPKSNTGPGFFGSIANFFSSLFEKKAKRDAKISTVLPGAAISRVKTVEVGEIIFEGFETIIKAEEILLATVATIGRASVWSLPLMLNGDASVPSTKVSDRDITRKPNSNNFYLYRNMIPNGTIPMLGQNRYTLGIRPLDVAGKTGDDFVYPSSLNGLSTTLGIGNSIPLNVPNKTDKTTLFRINAALLPAQGLIPVEIEGNYIRIIPGIRMTAQEFNLRIQLTAPLWTPVR